MNKNRILVPVDFSPCAVNALDYALQLATRVKSEVIIFHSVIYNESTFISQTDKDEENTKRYNEAIQKINILKESLSSYKSLSIITKVEGGNPIASIEQLLTSESFNYIVMGTEGASGIKATIFGSFATDLLNNISCPIFIIPPQAKFSTNHILCATELHNSELPAIYKLMKFSEFFNSKITFLNICNDHEKEEFHSTVFKKIKEARLNVEFKTEPGKEVAESIEKYACEHHYDLIVTLGKQRNFIDKIIGTSITKRICLQTTVPILCFPHSDFK